RGLMDRAAALDETVDHGGPARALGAWYAALPAGSGGGAKKSRTWFDRALKVAPSYLLTKVEEARTYAVLVQDRALFERLLGEVASFDLDKAPAIRRENAVAKREAKTLRARADRLF
ncbi:MAG TPA: TRAP transporter TatT component family protein, partial [Anaeromyxobacteraceae bacterium]|nr:TRAP transporter TatT component family protein [Anaeromyxobacteraceae bacterium]